MPVVIPIAAAIASVASVAASAAASVGAISAATAATIGTVAATVGTAASIAGTVYGAVQSAKAGGITGAVGAAARAVQLPGELARFAEGIGLLPTQPPEVVPAISVAAQLSKTLGEDLTKMVAQFAQTMKPLAELDPRLRDIIVPLLGIGGKTMPELGAIVSMSVGRPRRRFRDLPLLEFTGVDEDVQPLGEVIDEVWRSEAALSRQVMQETSRRQEEKADTQADAIAGVEAAVTGGFGTTGDTLKAALSALPSGVRDVVLFFLEGLSRAITEGILPRAESVAEYLTPVISVLVGLLVQTLERAGAMLDEPVSAGLRGPLADFFKAYRGDIAHTAPIEPADAPALAANAFTAATRFGLTAHLLATIVELVHPLKHLGLPQLAAGLVDAAAFGPIMGQTIGRSITVGLGRATEWQARRDFRTVWPSLRDVEQMYHERRISREDYAERLRWEGWPERWIEAFLALREGESVAVPWIEPRLFDLAVTFEDVDVPEAWILQMIRQQGYSDDDAEHILAGLKVRSTRSYRSGLISEVNATYQDGLLTEDDFRRFLAPLRLREETLGILLARANLGLATNQAKKLLAAQRTLVEQDVIPLDQFRVSARALGFIDSQVEAEAAVIDARQKGRLLKQEQAEVEKELRKVQEKIATVAEEQVRRGLATPDQMEAALLQAGFEPQLAKAAAELARVRQRPVLQLPEARTPEAQTQRVSELVKAEVLARVQREELDPGLAGLHLASLGIPTDEALALVRLAVARIPKKPVVTQPPAEAPEVREARRIRTQQAVARFQAGDLDEAGLRMALRAAGVAPDVVEATVSREATEKRIREQQAASEAKTRAAREAATAAAQAAAQAERERAAAFQEIQRLQRDIILAALRKGTLDPDDARVGLTMIGLSAAEADLLVTREQLR